MDSKALLKKALEAIDLNKLIDIIIEDVIVEEINKIVADSTNKFDDAAAAMLLPILVPQAKAALYSLAAELKK